MPENRRHRDDRDNPTVTTDDHHVTVPTTPPKPIVKQDDASSSNNVTDNTGCDAVLMMHSASEPLTWDDVFGDLDVRTLDHDERLDLINDRIARTLQGKTWAAKTAGEEGELAWDGAVRTFLDGVWVACIFCCHVVCEREVAGIISTSVDRLNRKIPDEWETFGLGRLLNLARKHALLPPALIDDVRRVTDARKPYGHWRSSIHEESMMQRVSFESERTGNLDRSNLVERILVRDATHAMLTAIRLYFASYGFGGRNVQ